MRLLSGCKIIAIRKSSDLREYEGIATHVALMKKPGSTTRSLPPGHSQKEEKDLGSSSPAILNFLSSLKINAGIINKTACKINLHCGQQLGIVDLLVQSVVAGHHIPDI